jgi:hypothetical protein
MTIASARDEIRRRRHLTPIGVDPLAGPWRILSTGGDYSHELHLADVGAVTCSTCLARHGRRTCWATDRVLQSLGQAKVSEAGDLSDKSEKLSWRSAFDEARRHRSCRDPQAPASNRADHQHHR